MTMVTFGEHGGDLSPGQPGELAVQNRLVAFHHRHVTRPFDRDQPVQVRPHRQQRIEGHGGTGQVQPPQQRPEHPGLAALPIDLDLTDGQPVAVGHRGQQMDLAAVGPPRTPAGLPVHRERPTLTARHHDRAIRCRLPAVHRQVPVEQRGSQRPPAGRGHHPTQRRFVGNPIPAGERIERQPQPAQLHRTGPLGPLPDRPRRVMSGRGQPAQPHRQQRSKRIRPAPRRPRIRNRLQPLPDSRPRHTTRCHHSSRGTRQYPCRHTTPQTTKTSTSA